MKNDIHFNATKYGWYVLKYSCPPPPPLSAPLLKTLMRATSAYLYYSSVVELQGSLSRAVAPKSSATFAVGIVPAVQGHEYYWLTVNFYKL